MLVFSVFNVFKILFGLNTYSVTVDRVYIISHKRERLLTLEDKFVLTS